MNSEIDSCPFCSEVPPVGLCGSRVMHDCKVLGAFISSDIKNWNTRHKRTCRVEQTGCATGICSACGGEFCASVCTNEPPDYVKSAPFCPNCGAEVLGE